MNTIQHLAAALATVGVGFLLYMAFFAILISMIPTKSAGQTERDPA